MTDEIAGLARGRRILVVEDEYFMAVDLAEELEAFGAVVVGPVATVSGAMDLLDRETSPDAVSLDVNLGQDRSYKVADALLSRGIPFVFLTGYGDRDLPERYRSVRRCEKPFDTATLVRALFKDDDP